MTRLFSVALDLCGAPCKLPCTSTFASLRLVQCSAIPWNCPRCKHSWKRSKSSNFWTEACKQNYCHLLARSPIIFTLQKDEINQVCKIHLQIFPYIQCTFRSHHLMQSASVSPSTARFYPLTCFPGKPCPLPLPSVPRVLPPSDATEWRKLFFFRSSISISIDPSLYLPTNQPINLSTYLSVYLSVIICLYLSIYLSILFADLPSPNGFY